MMAMTIGATVALALAGATEQEQKPTLEVVAKVAKLEDGVVLVERALTKTKLALLRRRGLPEVSGEDEIMDGSIFDGRLFVAYPMTPELTQRQGDAKKWIGRSVKLQLRRNEAGRWSIERMSLP
ncbi:MAG: hypothetical protein AAGD10_01785 [Myxococcota bacterium]